MNKKAFTLLELMIVITIVFMVSMGVYAPYKYYGQQTDIKLAAKQIEQYLYTARNSALHGTASGSNMSFGLFFSGNGSDEIHMYGYPYNTDPSLVDISSGQRMYNSKISLQKNITVADIAGYESALFFYEAISGDMTVIGLGSDQKKILESDKIDIIITYKGSDADRHRKDITYYTQTHTIDY